MSGRICDWNGEVILTGPVEDTPDAVDAGRKAAEICAPKLLHRLNEVAEDNHDRVDCVLNLGSFVNCAPGFPHSPRVFDGASDPFTTLFGDEGWHAPTRHSGDWRIDQDRRLVRCGPPALVFSRSSGALPFDLLAKLHKRTSFVIATDVSVIAHGPGASTTSAFDISGVVLAVRAHPLHAPPIFGEPSPGEMFRVDITVVCRRTSDSGVRLLPIGGRTCRHGHGHRCLEERRRMHVELSAAHLAGAHARRLRPREFIEKVQSSQQGCCSRAPHRIARRCSALADAAS
jgi:hypothetical protein